MLWTAALAAQSLTVSPLELDFEAELGKPSPPSQTFQIQAPAGQSFSARVNRGTIVNPGWLFDPVPTNGQTPATLTVSVDTSGFTAPGTSAAEILVTVGSEQVAVKVNITVAPASQSPTINAAPSALSFNIQSAGLTAPPQDLIISNSGGGFLNYQVGFSYPASGPQGWLQISPTSGHVSFDSALHSVSLVNTLSLQQGNYTAQIVVTGNATNSPFSIPVNLSVGAAPALSATPTSLSFVASEGGAFPAIQTVTIRNSGGTDVQYSIAGDQPWLFVRPPTGDTAAGPQVHEVAPDIRGLSQGVYLGNLQVTGPSLGAPFLIPVRLTIGAPSSLFVLPSRLDFLGNTSIPIRERRSISVVNTPLGPGPWTAKVKDASDTWLKVSPAQGDVPSRIQVEVDTTGLGASTLDAVIVISSGTDSNSFALGEEGKGPEQAISTIEVPVQATILASRPALDAAPKALRFHFTAGQGGVLQQTLLVDNTGGPQLLWQSEATTESGDWLSISPTAGEAPTRTRVSADASGLGPGVYHGRVRLVAGGQSVVVPVALVVSAAGAVLDTDVTSLYWEMAEGGAPPSSREVQVLNRGAGTMSWTAQAVDFSGSQQWFGFGPASGASRADGLAGPDSFTVSPIGTGLSPGVYGGLIEVRAADQNSRLVSVTLRVAPVAETVQRRVDPGGVAFVAGAGLAPKTAVIRRNRSGAAPFVAGVATSSGTGWLSATPASGSAAEDGSVSLDIEADPTGLAAGIYEGQVGVTFGDGLVETVLATLIVPPTGQGVCTPSSFAITPASPPEGFRALMGRAVQLEAELWDNCGKPVDQASVLASFSAGDPAIPLQRVAAGRYAATWAPANAGSQANVVFTAMAGALTARKFVVGAVEGSSHPAISSFGVVNAGSFGSGEAISPGAIISAFGRNFLPEIANADAVPLPETLGGLRMWLGGHAAPLYFKNNGQINAQAPFELKPNATAQAVVAVEGAYSVPEEVAVATARPGVFFFPSAEGPGRVIAQNQNGTINGPAQPARRGEALVVYLSGIGVVAPAVATGAGAPGSEPLARANAAATAAVGDKPAQIFFLGLTPGFVGLAQANLTIPADAPIGPDVPLSITVDGQTSNPLVVSIGAAQP
jgi:uncharacterized protein (TIGR03437 family)